MIIVLFNIFFVGLSKIKLHCCELQQYENVPINKLCTFKDGKYHFVFFQYAGDLINIAEPFWEVTKTSCSNIYIVLWKKSIANCNHSITISDVKTQLWDPTYEACKALLQKICTLKITFSEFDDYFGPTDGLNIISNDLRFLSQGLSSNITLDNACIENICQCVEICRKLQRSHHSALLVLNVKMLLSLTGDFDHLEHVAKVSDFSMRILVLIFNILITANITGKTMDNGIYTRRNGSSCYTTRRHQAG